MGPEIPILTLGFDPDLTTAAWALVRHERRTAQVPHVPKLVGVGIFRAPASTAGLPIIKQIADNGFPACQFAVVETMKIYLRKGSGSLKSKVNPVDLLRLQTVAGAALARLMAQGCLVMPCSPAEWKGQRHKDQHHPLIAQALGLTIDKKGGPSGYPVPGSDVLASDWKHLWDAAGMALHAFQVRSTIGALYATRVSS